MGNILEKIKKKNCVFVCTYTIRLLYGSYIGEIKEFFFLRFCMNIYYKAIVWVTFCRKLIFFFFLRFCMDLHYKAIVWIIFWRKLEKKILRFCMNLNYKAIACVIFWRKLIFFCVSV
jgi:hypothetical protein